MTEAAVRKLNVMFAFPSYGGNGGISSEHPAIRNWYAETLLKIRSDPRVGSVSECTLNDTPITMVRNRFVNIARQRGAHVLIMMDSDQDPMKYEGESWYKPFWGEAFDAIYEHYDKGPLVVGAPYCGPPDGGELCYVFYFENEGVRGDETAFSLEMYPRTMAAQMSGVQECAALPTGLMMCDMRIFDMLEPGTLPRRDVLERLVDKKITVSDAERMLSDGWFYYDWVDATAAEKASTEDVAFSRDVALVGIANLGYNPLRCAWDSWIGHFKPQNVGKPKVYGVNHVGNTIRRAVERGQDTDEKQIFFQASPKVLNLLGVA